MDILAKGLQNFLEKQGISQAELSERIGVSQASISHYVNDKRTPDIKTLKKIATFLNVSINFLLGGVDYQEEFTLIVTDSRMSPELLEGDVVTIRSQDGITGERKIHLVQVGGRQYLCKTKACNNGIFLIPANTHEYAPFFYSCDEVEKLPVKVIGVVTKMIRTLNQNTKNLV